MSTATNTRNTIKPDMKKIHEIRMNRDIPDAHWESLTINPSARLTETKDRFLAVAPQTMVYIPSLGDGSNDAPEAFLSFEAALTHWWFFSEPFEPVLIETTMHDFINSTNTWDLWDDTTREKNINAWKKAHLN